MSEEIKVTHISINTEGTAFVVCTTQGIIAYDLYPLQRKYEAVFNSDFGPKQGEVLVAVELISNSNYIAIAYNRPATTAPTTTTSSSSSSSSSSSTTTSDTVSTTDKSFVVVYDVHEKKNVSRRELTECITCMKVKFNYENPTLSKLCIGTKDRVCIYNIHNLDDPHIITSCTPHSLSISAVNDMLVTENNKGVIIVKDFTPLQSMQKDTNENSKSTISAVSRSGRMIASASETGTVIKVLDTEYLNGDKIRLRRGTSNNATIASMAFSHDDRLFALSSSRETIHVYYLEKERQTVSWSWGGMVKPTVSANFDISPPKSSPPGLPDAISFKNSVITFCDGFGDGDDCKINVYKLIVITRKGDYIVYEIDTSKKMWTIKGEPKRINLMSL